MARDFFEAWERFVIYFRLVLCALFLPIMIVGGVLFSDGRPIAVLAVVVLSYRLYRDIRTIRQSRRNQIASHEINGMQGAGLHDHAVDFLELRRDFLALWRVHVVVVFAQVFAGVICWQIGLLPGVLANLGFGAAAGSFPGLLIGLAVQSAHSDRWRQSSGLFRTVYIANAVLMTFVAAPLIAFVLSAP